MAQMEQGLQISLKRYTLLMAVKMVAGGLGHTTNYSTGEMSPLK